MPAPTKIISTRWDQPDGHTLDGYLRTGGYEGLRKALAMAPDAVVEEVKAANLAGRGGAGFPCGTKWSFLPKDVFPRYLVVNGDESEPGTYKDRILLERDPHQLIEGVMIAAWAIKAEQAFIYIRGEMPFAHERMAAALNEAYAAGYAGKNVCGTGWSIDVVLHWGAGAYIVGEETALIESLEGNRGMPRLKPPFFPASKGLYMQPTVVNNVETLANLPWIITNGASAFTAYGNEKNTGTRLFAVSGHVKKPGVFEVEFGTTTFRELFEDFAGGIREDRRVKAFIPGGGSAPWFFEEDLDTPLDAGVVGAKGSMLGSGAIVVMDETTDMVKAAWRIVKFFSKESCGKCSPCREGTNWLEKIYRRILDGVGRPEDIDLLFDVADNISPGLTWPPKQTTICPLGPSAAAGALVSSLRRFRPEYEHYIVHGRVTDGLSTGLYRPVAGALASAAAAR
jgi:NADH-quinone oxidoreductase subunit F